MITLDMRGRPCPIPVVEARKALAEHSGEGIAVLVDNTVAVQNLRRLAEGLGCRFDHLAESDAMHTVRVWPGDGVPFAFTTMPRVAPQGPSRGATVLIASDEMGRGGEELGRILIKGFLFSLTELAVLPDRVIFLNAGVKLACEGSTSLPDLLSLEEQGVIIRACGTCLNYYGLTNKLAVGEVTDMLWIAEALTSAGRVVSV